MNTSHVARTKQIFLQPGFAGVLGLAFALGLAYSFVSPFLSLWGTQEIGMGPVAFGLYMTVTSLSGILVATTLARWSDTHVPRKVMLLLGATGGVLGFTGYAFVRDPRVLVCIGTTALAISVVCFSQLFAYTRERFSAPNTANVPPAFLSSIVRGCFSLAWTAGPSIGAVMMVQFGFRGLFLGAAALFLVFLLGIARYVPFEPHAPHVRARIRQPVWRELTRGDVLAAFLAFLFVFAAHTINMMNLPLVVTKQLGGTGRDVGIIFGIGPLAEIPLMLWFGLLAARGHQLALIRIGAAATVVYFLLLTLARSPWQVMPIQILHGLSFAVISNVAILFFQDLLPGQPGLATTIFTNSANLGNLVGYFGFGTLLPAVGHRGMFFVSASLTAGMLAVVLLYRPRRSVADAG